MTQFNVYSTQSNQSVELSLIEKLSLANNPHVKEQLTIQQREAESKAKAADVTTFQEIIQEQSELEAKKLGIKSAFRIFIHPDETGDKTVRIREGLIVHVHLDCPNVTYITSKPFWDRMKDILVVIPKLTRSSALVVRSQYWEQRADTVPKWKKVNIGDEDIEFNLVSYKEMQFETEIKITRRHVPSKIVVIVSGSEHDRESLEREAHVLLSQKVAIYNHLQARLNNE